MLYVAFRTDGLDFSVQDKLLIQTLANHAAVIIARATLDEQVHHQIRQSAVLEERNRLARDVHDTLSHAFTSIKFLIEAARRIGSLDQATQCLVGAQKLAIDGAQEARRSAWALRPAALEEADDLVSAIRQLARRQTADTALQVEVTAVGASAELAPMLEENLLRICQEAVTNVLRHANAGHLTILLAFRGTDVTLSVTDDGCGFKTPTAGDGYGFGLGSMLERSRQIGGLLTVDSKVGGGTTVTVSVCAVAKGQHSQ